MALTQSHHRFGIAEGSESTHGWLAAEDKPVMLPPGRPFLARACVQETAGVAANNTVMQWQRRLLRGGVVVSDWADVTTTGSVVRTGTTTVFANGANCTRRLSGSGTFESSAAGCTQDGSAGGAANDIAANGNSETLIGLQIINADTAVGDTIELRVTRGGTTLLDAYAAVPTITVGVNVLAVQSYDPAGGPFWSASASGTRITDSVTTVVAAGMSAADLADPTLSMEMDVWGTTDTQASPPPESYTVHLQGPVGWQGGAVGKAGTAYGGMSIPPGFSFQEDIPQDVRRVRASFQPSRTLTFGADAAIVPQTQG